MMSLSTSARCLLADCPWTAEGEGADRAADSHTRRQGHATITETVPLPPVEGKRR